MSKTFYSPRAVFEIFLRYPNKFVIYVLKFLKYLGLQKGLSDICRPEIEEGERTSGVRKINHNIRMHPLVVQNTNIYLISS